MGGGDGNGDSNVDPIKQRMANQVASDKPTVIQRDLTITGAVMTDGVVELHGSLTGDLYAKRVLVGPGASMKGDIVSELVEVAGHVDGRVTARQVRLAPTARIKGAILHQRLAIEDGAEFEGNVLRKTDEKAWSEISKTFEIPGVDLTPEAKKAVDALKAEFSAKGA